MIQPCSVRFGDLLGGATPEDECDTVNKAATELRGLYSDVDNLPPTFHRSL
jgi:hypothetical protein